MVDFISKYEFDLVFEFNEKGAQRIFGNNVPTLFVFYDNENEKSLEAVKLLKEIAE